MRYEVISSVKTACITCMPVYARVCNVTVYLEHAILVPYIIKISVAPLALIAMMCACDCHVYIGQIIHASDTVHTSKLSK